jgi:hypothetical protein
MLALMVKEAAKRNFASVCINDVELGIFQDVITDILTGNTTSQFVTIWSGKGFFQGIKRPVRGNPNVSGGIQVVNYDAVLGVPVEALEDFQESNVIIVKYNNKYYSTDSAPVDAAGLGVYYSFELTGTQSG